VYCYPADAPIVTRGGGFRPLRATPGVVNWAVWRLFIRPILHRFARVDPTSVDHALYDGQVLPVAGGWPRWASGSPASAMARPSSVTPRPSSAGGGRLAVPQTPNQALHLTTAAGNGFGL
jgi:hypothetical protein